MRQLNFDLKKICEHNQDGSYATRSKRHITLQSIANTLDKLGYKKMTAGSLKPKHIDALVTEWKGSGLKAGSIKNNMTALRWWSAKIGKPAIVCKDNSHYGIANRILVTNIDKSVELSARQLDSLVDPYIRISVELQKAFGLRREEALKFSPAFAMQSLDRSVIMLKSSWTKGGKAREIPLTPGREQQQREVLARALSLAGRGSLIPANKNFVQQLRFYEGQTKQAGLSKLHGLRHLYAQDRYRELTGWECPARGGNGWRSMDKEKRAIDHQARLTISKELGHERKQVVSIYLGS